MSVTSSHRSVVVKVRHGTDNPGIASQKSSRFRVSFLFLVDPCLDVFLKDLSVCNTCLVVISRRSVSESRSRGIIHLPLSSAL